jgi:hypothetical protein
MIVARERGFFSMEDTHAHATLVQHGAMLGGMLLLALIMLMAMVFRRRMQALGINRKRTPHPGLMLESAALRLVMPPDSTLPVLPGRFEVAAGDNAIRSLRFYKAPGRAGVCITFGRQAGHSHTHVELKDPACAPLQATLSWSGQGYTLQNQGQATPTRVNGAALAVGGRAALRDGDQIALAGLVLVYRAG